MGTEGGGAVALTGEVAVVVVVAGAEYGGLGIAADVAFAMVPFCTKLGLRARVGTEADDMAAGASLNADCDVSRRRRG